MSRVYRTAPGNRGSGKITLRYHFWDRREDRSMPQMGIPCRGRGSRGSALKGFGQEHRDLESEGRHHSGRRPARQLPRTKPPLKMCLRSTGGRGLGVSGHDKNLGTGQGGMWTVVWDQGSQRWCGLSHTARGRPQHA